MPRYEKVRAVVVGSRPLGEADRVAVLFTREFGRADAVVKGVRKTSSRWGGRLEPFNVCDLVLFRGRSLFTVTSAQLVEMFKHLREEREAMTVAAVACEAAATLFAPGEPEAEAFALLEGVLRTADKGVAGPALQAPLLLAALVQMLAEAGLRPALDACVACGTEDGLVGFAAGRGGVVCARCLGDAAPLSPAALAALRAAARRPPGELAAAPPSAAVAEGVRHAHGLYSYHTGLRLRALRFARH
jgi:DNA repair protein RecO (recombination protein O)